MALDTETTGFRDEGGSMEMVQFAAVCENGSTFNRFFLPKGPFSAGATETNGLTMEKLRQMGARPFTEEDAKEILEFVGPRALVIMHNKWFDLNMLLKTFKDVKVYLPLKDASNSW